jgi:hypothetical protein
MRTYKESIQEFLTPVISGERLPAFFNADAQWMTGMPSELLYNDADINVEINLLTAEYFGSPGGAATWDVYNFEARALGQSVRTSEYGMPDIDYTDPLCQSEEDLYKISWPTDNPLDAGRYPLFLRSLDLVEKYTGNLPQMFGAGISSFSLAVELFSFAGFMKIIKKQPDLAHEIMRKIVFDIQVPLAQAVAALYPGILYKQPDAWEMLPNISPKIEQEFVLPYYDLLRESTKDLDIKVMWWRTYGEAATPDPAAYLKAKLKYNGLVSYTGTEDVPRETYVEVANECDVPLLVLAGPKMGSNQQEIIEFYRGLVRDFRIPTKIYTSYGGSAPYGSSMNTILATRAAVLAFNANPCPTLEELDKIQVKIEVMPQSFGDFVRAKASENPDGYTFKWLNQARFFGE